MKMTNIVALSAAEADFSYEQQSFGKRDDASFSVYIGKTKAEMMSLASDADVVLINAVTVDSEFLDALKKCKLMIRYGIGYDTIDVQYAAQQGIMVCNAPNYGAIDVAEHAMSLLLACTKRLIEMHDRVRANQWSVSGIGSSWRLAGKTIGLIGFGRIAKCVCTRAIAFDMQPVVYDPYVPEEVLTSFGAKAVTLDELLQKSDFITLHVPLTESTRHMINKDQLKKMKKSVILINTSRGGLVCEKDLIDALQSGVIAGAGLDVFEDEQGGLDPRILSMPNVTLTPHVAWNTLEAFDALHKEVTGNVLNYLNGKKPDSVVNGL